MSTCSTKPELRRSEYFLALQQHLCVPYIQFILYGFLHPRHSYNMYVWQSLLFYRYIFKEFSHTENAFIIHIQIPLCDMSVFIFKDDVNKQQYNKWDDYDWFLIIFLIVFELFPCTFHRDHFSILHVNVYFNRVDFS